MLSWFEFRRRNEARWDRLIDAAVEARHHGVSKPQRPIRTWAPTALAAVALAGVGGMAGHTLATPTAISVASAAESSSIDGASTSVPGRADDPVNDAATGSGRDASGVGASADPDADGADAAGSVPGDAPSSPPGGAGPGAGDDAAGAPEPTVIGPIIAGDTAIGPITVTRGPQGPEVVGEVPVEEGDTGGGSGTGDAGAGASTVTATPAPSGDAAPDDGSDPGASGGGAGSSTPTSGANPGSDSGTARAGEGSSPTSGSAPSGAAGDTGAGDAGGDDDEPGSGSSAGEREPGGAADADAGGEDGQDEDGDQCATTGPEDDTAEGSGSSGSAGAQRDGGSARDGGSGGASSTTSAAPDGSRSDLSRGADQEPYDEPDQGGESSAGSAGSSGSSETGASGGSAGSGTGGSGDGAPDSAEGAEQQERAGEDGARECADDDAGTGASEDDGGVAGKATDALFSLTGVEGFDLGQGGNVENGEVPAEAPSPNVPGHTAVKMELPAGGKRSEVRPQEVAQDIKAGQKMFFGYSAFLPEDFPTDASDFQVIWQLHSESSTSSPPLALEVQQGKLWLANVGELVEDLGPVNAGENVTVQMGIDFEVGGGAVTVWRDGEEILSDFQPPRGTMIDNLNYLKTGLYRREEGSPASSLFLNDMKVGDTLESVSGLAGGPTATQESGVAGALGSTTGALLGGVLPVAGMRWRRRRMEW